MSMSATARKYQGMFYGSHDHTRSVDSVRDAQYSCHND